MVTRESVFNSEEEQIRLLLHCLQSGTRIHPVSSRMGHIPLSRQQGGQGVNVTGQHHPVPRLSVRETIPALPHTPLWNGA
jgi:hypothetical protein